MQIQKSIQKAFRGTVMIVKLFLKGMETQDNLNPSNNILRTKMVDYMEKMKQMNALVKIIQPFEAERCHPRQAMILPGLAGIGICFLAKNLLWPSESRSNNIRSKRKEECNSYVKCRQTGISTNNMNQLKNFSKAIDKKIHWQTKRTTDDKHRSFLIWKNQKEKLTELLNEWKMATHDDNPLLIRNDMYISNFKHKRNNNDDNL